MTCSRLNCHCGECVAARQRKRNRDAKADQVLAGQRIAALEATVREQTKAHDQLRREFNDAIARLRQGWRP